MKKNDWVIFWAGIVLSRVHKPVGLKTSFTTSIATAMLDRRSFLSDFVCQVQSQD